MPELPEVEILAREVRQNVLGRRVQSVEWDGGQALEIGHERLPELAGGKLTGVRRFGKRLSLDFDNGLSLVIHLMLVGQLRYSGLTDEVPADLKLALAFDDGSRFYLSGSALRFQRLLPSEDVARQEAVLALGPDPLSDDLTERWLADGLRRKNAAIKAVLLEQALIGGIGNTYTDEALFLAGINPHTRASSLELGQVTRLRSSVRQVMQEAIERGGASEMAFVHLDGQKGHYQEAFRVKQRKGQPCVCCGTPIVKETVSGRPTYYCPVCQPLE